MAKGGGGGNNLTLYYVWVVPEGCTSLNVDQQVWLDLGDDPPAVYYLQTSGPCNGAELRLIPTG